MSDHLPERAEGRGQLGAADDHGDDGTPEAASAGRVVQVSNATTVRAMKELDERKGQRFDSAEELFHDLGI